MTKYEKFYTKEMDTIIKKVLNIKNLLPENLYFIDTSCGDNTFVKKLLKNNLISNYSSYDISPSNNYYGNISKKDWLKEVIQNERYLSYKTMVGFNPPYGFGSKKAKKFIKKGYIEQYDYCIWLVPISLRLFLCDLYDVVFQKEFISMLFFDNNTNDNKTIKQSVFLFIGKRKQLTKNEYTTIFLSKRKVRKKSPFSYILKRTHNEGIREDTTIILKKTGNPVFFPSFYREDISKNVWFQINKNGVIKDKASLEKVNGKYVMNGKHITKHLNNDYKYAVDSNVYVKLSGLEKYVDIVELMQTFRSIGNTEDFFNMVNKYKPAAITIGWLREFLDKYIKSIVDGKKD